MSFCIDLPLPPSKNATHSFGKKRVYLSDEYVSWMKSANGIFISLGLNRGRKPIAGKFAVKVFVREGIKLDPQNIIDPLMDWAQRVGVVENDKNLRSLHLSYGDIGGPCRLIVEAV